MFHFKTVFDSEFIRVEFDKARMLMLETYLPGTDRMEEEELKAYALDLVKLMERLGVKRYVLDQRKSAFVYSPEVQKWIAQNVTPAWVAMGLEKFVMVEAEELIANLSGEQAFDEGIHVVEGKMEVRRMLSYEGALKWAAE